MKILAQVGLFALALVIDSTRLINIPLLGGIHPLLFSAVVVSFAVSAGAFTGGLWGFIGGLSFGLLAGNPQVGSLTMGGFLSGSLPVLLRPLLFWRRWTSQVVLGFVSVLLFNLVVFAVSVIRGETNGFSWLTGLRMTSDAVLTALICPMICAGMARLEARH